MKDRFAVLGVDHVNVTTPEELQADVVQWYESCLGLRPVEKPQGTRLGGAWFKAGEQEVHVSIDEHNPPKAAHFAIAVDDCEAVVERLRGSGCHIEQARPIAGRKRFFTRDPAGNRIEIVTYDSPRAP